MSRDGSSGGVIRTAVITQDGVQRETISAEQIPKFWGMCVSDMVPTSRYSITHALCVCAAEG